MGVTAGKSVFEIGVWKKCVFEIGVWKKWSWIATAACRRTSLEMRCFKVSEDSLLGASFL